MASPQGLLTPLEQQTYQSFGMLPNSDRLSILPRYNKKQGLIAPEFIYELAKAVSAPYTAAQGYEITPQETVNTALNMMGGSAAGTAPKGALRSGFARDVKPTGLLGKAGQLSPAVPETMYHGTASDIQAFRPGNTVYVSPSPKFAESYAGTQSPNIMPLRANVANPFNYESAADIQKLAESYKKLHGEDLFSKKTISSAGGEMKLSQLDKNPISQRLKSGDWTIIEDKKVQDAIKKAGFDAFYIEEGGVKNLGVYDPTKLKSVFSPTGDVKPAGLLGKPEVQDLSYRSSHKAPSPEFGAPLYDLTGGGQMYPADVYSSKAAQYYGTGFPKADQEAFALANKVRGNPNAEVTMYRAVPKKDDIKAINAGDWVTLSKEYAKVHGQSVLNNDYKIISKKVKAKDLWTNADSIHEFGYNPSK